MVMEHLRIDPLFDEHPDVERAGWAGKELFHFLLRLSARMDLGGAFDSRRLEPAWIARRWELTADDLGGVDPVAWIGAALQRCIASGLLASDGQGGAVICGWETFYQPKQKSTPRVQAFRALRSSQLKRDETHETPRNVLKRVKRDETPETPTPLHSTPLHKEETLCAADAAPAPEPNIPGELLLVPDIPKSTPEALQALWNDLVPPPMPRYGNGPKRRKAALVALQARRLDGEDGWAAVFQRIAASAFCQGRSERGWRASPDWALAAGNAEKVLEGKYDNPAATGPPRGRASEADRDWSRPRDWKVDENGEVVL
jgi:hypothetical protein